MTRIVCQERKPKFAMIASPASEVRGATPIRLAEVRGPVALKALLCYGRGSIDRGGGEYDLADFTYVGKPAPREEPIVGSINEVYS